MVQRLIEGLKLSEKKRTLTNKSNTLNHVHPHLKDAALFSSVSKAKAQLTQLLQPLELLVLKLGKRSQRK